MTKYFIPACLTLLLTGLSPAAAPVPSGSSPAGDLDQLAQRLIGPKPLEATRCAPELRSWTRVYAARPANLKPVADARSLDLIRKSFLVRTHLRDRLRAWTIGSAKVNVPAACVTELRRTAAALRLVEDRASLAVDGPGAGVVPNAQAVQTLNGPESYLTTADGRPVRLRSGDILVSRGNAFVSAAIAKIAVAEGDFSHLAQVYIDAPVGTEVDADRAADDPRAYTIEAHIEVGSFTRPYADYVKDGNARVAQFRPRQSAERAHRAAKIVFDWVRAWRRAHADAYKREMPTVNDNIPYDFKMVLTNADEVFCAEIVSIAQRAVGWSVPMFPSALRKNQVTEAMGITARQTFAPSDLEVDPRFEQLSEWRNLPKLPAVLKNDVVFRELFRRMDRGEFAFEITPADHAKAVFAWTARQADLAFLDRLPKNMSTSVIALTFAIDRAGADWASRLVSAP